MQRNYDLLNRLMNGATEIEWKHRKKDRFSDISLDNKLANITNN